MSAADQTPWQVVVPVKGDDLAKTRLAVEPSDRRLTLARAFALDTIAATARALAGRPGSRLVVVSADASPNAWPEADALVPDPGGGLNAAVEAGLALCPLSGHRAALLGDLPALRAGDLDAALTAAAWVARGLVPDADGRGTVLITAGPGIRLLPAFGRDSALAHAAAGHDPLDVHLPRLATDVDVLDDLETVLALGVGAHTRQVLAGRS